MPRVESARDDPVDNSNRGGSGDAHEKTRLSSILHATERRKLNDGLAGDGEAHLSATTQRSDYDGGDEHESIEHRLDTTTATSNDFNPMHDEDVMSKG